MPALLRSSLPLALMLTLAACNQPPAEPAAAAPAAAAPATDPTGAVLLSMERFQHAKRFHAVMQLEGPRPLRTELEFEAPDRYRLNLQGTPQIIIGDTAYLEQDGRYQAQPLPPGALAQWRNPLQIDGRPESIEVTDEGADTIDGRPVRRYQVRHRAVDGPGMRYWISADGLPARITQQGETLGQTYVITITYSRFDDPAIHIAQP